MSLFKVTEPSASSKNKTENQRRARALYNKNLRNALYIASGGRCTICGVELGFSFHADHKVPFKIDRETNPHGMQATCATCNCRKGAKLVWEAPDE